MIRQNQCPDCGEYLYVVGFTVLNCQIPMYSDGTWLFDEGVLDVADVSYECLECGYSSDDVTEASTVIAEGDQ